jgi:hypothetical protein
VSDSTPAANPRKPTDDGVSDPTSDETLVTDNTSEVVAEAPLAEAPAPEDQVPVAQAPEASQVDVPAAPIVDDESPAAAEPVAEPVVATEAAEPVVATDAAVETPAQPSPHVVYIEAPQAPRKKGNRAIGSLIALASAVLFAVLYAVILFLVELGIEGSANFGFLSNEAFWTPVVVFAIGFIILVVIANRAGWAAYVVGSIVVGVFTYFATAAIILLLNASHLKPSEAGEFFQVVLTTPAIIIAGLLAREVSLWVGFAIAARGRRVRARNAEAREAYEREFAATRAEYDRANTARVDAARAGTNAPANADA